MKLTVLDIVQDILNDIDSDEVNSIDDTIESLQVAQILKSSYLSMMSERNWPHMKRPLQLEASVNLAQPTSMVLQEDVKELTYINYDISNVTATSKQYRAVRYLYPDEFLRHTNNRNSENSTVDVVQDDSGIELFILNNAGPTYYTSFDETIVVFDSYDSEVESTLQASKMQAQGYVNPVWTMSDEFIPDLPSEAFQGLQEEAKSRASLKLRQIQDVKAEQISGQQKRWMAQKAWRVHGGIRYPDYGRRNVSSRRDVTFDQDRQ